MSGANYDAEQAAPLMSKQIPDIQFIPPTAPPNETPPQWNLPPPTPSGSTAVQYHQPQSTVVVVNPAQIKPQPEDYLNASIWLTLCCCWPIGIFAILKSIKCRDAKARGDVTEATALSKATLKLLHWTVGVGVACNVILIGLMLVFMYWWFTEVMPMLAKQNRGERM